MAALFQVAFVINIRNRLKLSAPLCGKKKGEETVDISDWNNFFHVQTKAAQSFCKAMYFRMYKI